MIIVIISYCLLLEKLSHRLSPSNIYELHSHTQLKISKYEDPLTASAMAYL